MLWDARWTLGRLGGLGGNLVDSGGLGDVILERERRGNSLGGVSLLLGGALSLFFRCLLQAIYRGSKPDSEEIQPRKE